MLLLCSSGEVVPKEDQRNGNEEWWEDDHDKKVCYCRHEEAAESPRLLRDSVVQVMTHAVPQFSSVADELKGKALCASHILCEERVARQENTVSLASLRRPEDEAQHARSEEVSPGIRTEMERLLSTGR